MKAAWEALSECRDCGLLQHLPEVPNGSLGACSRCDAVLQQAEPYALPFSIASSTVGLLLFGLACRLPVASVSMLGGRFASSDLFTGPELLQGEGSWVLAVAVVLTLLVLPPFQLFAILAMG